MTKSFTRALALIVALSGCSLIDTTDGPAITFEDRLCNTNSDCIGLESTLVDLDGITTRPCIVIGTECNTSRNRCVVTVEEVNDVDGDGEAAMACGGNDCDDTRATVKPGAREACDGFISDCSAANGGTPRPAEDADGDEFARSDAECEPGGFPKTDCDDTNPNTYPGAPEVCDGEINTCETLGPRALEDMDGDAHAAPSADCLADIGNVNVYTKDDCDDTNGSTYPGAPEVCDRIFNDCSSTMPRIVEDADNDGRASFLASCSGGPIPKADCVTADLDPTTQFCAPDEEAPIAMGVQFEALVAFDASGDGRTDVFAAAGGALLQCTSSASVPLTFSCGGVGTTGANVIRLRRANLDETGPLDVISVSAATGQIRWASGGVTNPIATAATVLPANEIGFDVGDNDGDGDDDIFYGNRTNGSIELAVNVGVWPMEPAPVVTVATGIVAPRALTVDDFNGDGFLDVVASSEALVGGATRVVAYFANPAVPGTWLAGVDISTTIAKPYFVESGDLDDDGDSDVVVASATSGALTVFVNQAGAFTAVAVPLPLSDLTALEVADFDLDGDLDFGAASRTRDTIAWWETRGSGIWVRHDIVTDFDGASGVVAGDIDGDGDPDFVGSALNAARVTWWRSHYVSDVAFQSVSIDRAYGDAGDVSLADLDADGDLDFVASATGDDLVTAWINVNGAGTILNEIAIDANFPLAANVVVADIDGDDDLDVAGIGEDGLVRWWSNEDGLGRTWMTHAVGTFAGALDLDAGDLDGDADVDLAVSGTGLRVLVNDGAGTFAPTVVGTVTLGRGVAIADVSGDGSADIVVAEGTPSSVLLFAGTGDGTTFAAVGLGSAGTGLAGMFAVGAHDFDLDGRRDIVALGTGGVRVILNREAGFVARAVAAPFAGASDVTAGDIDADGDLDIFATSTSGNAILWYESTSADASVWVPHVVAQGAVALGPKGIDVGDIDGDGDIDIATALTSSSDLVWWKSDGTTWWNP